MKGIKIKHLVCINQTSYISNTILNPPPKPKEHNVKKCGSFSSSSAISFFHTRSRASTMMMLFPLITCKKRHQRHINIKPLKLHKIKLLKHKVPQSILKHYKCLDV